MSFSIPKFREWCICIGTLCISLFSDVILLTVYGKIKCIPLVSAYVDGADRVPRITGIRHEKPIAVHQPSNKAAFIIARQRIGIGAIYEGNCAAALLRRHDTTSVTFVRRDGAIIHAVCNGHICTAGDLRNDTGGAAMRVCLILYSRMVRQMIQIYCDISNGFADQSSGVTAGAYHLRSAVHRAIAHRSAAYDTSDQSTDSTFTGDTCVDQVDIPDNSACTYIAEQADVAPGGDLQPGDLVPVAIKGALKQLRLIVTNGCPGVLRKRNTFIQYNRITTEFSTIITIVAKVFRSSALVM